MLPKWVGKETTEKDHCHFNFGGSLATNLIQDYKNEGRRWSPGRVYMSKVVPTDPSPVTLMSLKKLGMFLMISGRIRVL